MKEAAKFELKDLLGIAFTIIVLGIGIAYGMDVMKDSATDMCGDAGGTFEEGECRFCPNVSVYNVTAQDCYNTTTGAPFGGAPVYTQGQSGGAVNATMDAMTGTATMTSKLPTIATVIVASVIIGILVTYLWMRFQ